jgi:hypothetical protein
MPGGQKQPCAAGAAELEDPINKRGRLKIRSWPE